MFKIYPVQKNRVFIDNLNTLSQARSDRKFAKHGPEELKKIDVFKLRYSCWAQGFDECTEGNQLVLSSDNDLRETEKGEVEKAFNGFGDILKKLDDLIALKKDIKAYLEIMESVVPEDKLCRLCWDQIRQLGSDLSSRDLEDAANDIDPLLVAEIPQVTNSSGGRLFGENVSRGNAESHHGDEYDEKSAPNRTPAHTFRNNEARDNSKTYYGNHYQKSGS